MEAGEETKINRKAWTTSGKQNLMISLIHVVMLSLDKILNVCAANSVSLVDKFLLRYSFRPHLIPSLSREKIKLKIKLKLQFIRFTSTLKF